MTFDILICTVPGREHFLDRLVGCLKPQLVAGVNVLCNTGDEQIGVKRNELLMASSARYVAFVDDDDEVSDDYVSLIMAAISLNPDMVTINMDWYVNGEYNRTLRPMHLAHLFPTRRDIACLIGYPPVSNGEDESYTGRIMSSGLISHIEHTDAVYKYYQVKDDTSHNVRQEKARASKSDLYSFGSTDSNFGEDLFVNSPLNGGKYEM